MRRKQAEPVYLVMSAVMSLADSMMFAVMSLYFVQRVHLDPLQLVLVGTVLEGTILLFEIPTGVVADVFSRRLSVLCGVFLLGFSRVVQGMFPLALAIFCTEVLVGIGYTFLSGATQAWLADEIGEESVNRVFLRSGQINRLIELPASLVGIGLGTISLAIPVVLGGGLYLVLFVLLLVVMPEKGFHPTPKEERSTWQHLFETLRQGVSAVRASPLLKIVVGVNLFVGLASEGFDRLWEAHILKDMALPSFGHWQPVVWFGLLKVLGALFSFGVVGIWGRRVREADGDFKRTVLLLFWFNVLTIGSLLLFAWATDFWMAVVFLMIRGAVGSLLYPLYDSWVVQSIDPKVRATVLSITSQSNALGQVAGGPGVGMVGKYHSLRWAIFGAGLLQLPNLLLYYRAYRRGGEEGGERADT